MTPEIKNAFEAAEKMQMQYYGIQNMDTSWTKVLRKIDSPEKMEHFKSYLLNIPPGPYLLVCRRGSRDPLIKYPVNTVNAVFSEKEKNKDFPEKVTKTQKDVDPEKYGRLTAQLEYQEKQINELISENAALKNVISDLESQIEDLENESIEMSEPAAMTPLNQLAQSLQPVVPVLAESLVDWIKSKAVHQQQAQPVNPEQIQIDYNILSDMIIRKSNEAMQQQQNGGNYATT